MKSKIALFAASLAIAVFGLLPAISQASTQETSCCEVQAPCCASQSVCCDAGVKKTEKQQVNTSAADCCAPDAPCCVPGAACCG